MLTNLPNSVSAPITGTLSGTGADLLRVTVYIGQVPVRPPASLKGLLSPIYDDAGHLHDWRLDPAHAERHVETADYGVFRVWRSSYACEHFIGERALVQAFLDWAAMHCDVSALQILRLPKAHVDFRKAFQMRLQVDQARKVIEATHELAIGVFANTGRSATRALIPTDPPTTLLAIGGTAVSVGSDGLQLRGDLDAVSIHSWYATDDGIVAITDDGELALGNEAGARLLQILGRHTPHAEIRKSPMSSLLAQVLIFLKDAAQMGGETNAGLYIRSTGINT